MEIVSYITGDFTLTVSCGQIESLYGKAERHIKDISGSTYYRFIGASGTLSIWMPGSKALTPVEDPAKAHPVFFENAEFHIEILFNEAVDRFHVHSQLKEITERFNIRNRGAVRTISGSINFGNDIGMAELAFSYEKGGDLKKLSFQFEVFSAKLDYKHDHKTLVKEIEDEYSKLALDLLKKTWFGFATKFDEGNDLTWWSIFAAIFADLTAAMKFVLNRPHSRLVNMDEFCKKERIKRLTPQLEEELFRYRQYPGKYYKVVDKRLSPDTLENRFLKHVAGYAYQKFKAIALYIREKKGKLMSKDYEKQLAQAEKGLESIVSHPLFRMTGDFTGMTQESAVLQKKPGYSAVYSNWIILRRSIRLFEDIQRIELKSIAELYQFWCFFKIKTIIRSLLDKEPDDVDLENMVKENFLSTLKKGVSAGVTFTSRTGDTIQLYHELTYGRRETGRHAAGVFTEEQRPDITLKITKHDLPGPQTFTYLFDAKYRSDSDIHGFDRPPGDAINQMHRYRDAIYDFDDGNGIRKTVMGGYILFPGAAPKDRVIDSHYFKSIEEINIGGFPLVPGDKHNTEILLRDHLREILVSDSHTLLRKVIPHKGLRFYF